MFGPWNILGNVVCVGVSSCLFDLIYNLPHYIRGGKCGVTLHAFCVMWVHPPLMDLHPFLILFYFMFRTCVPEI